MVIDEDELSAMYTELISKREIVAKNILESSGIIDHINELIKEHDIKKIQFEVVIPMGTEEFWVSFKNKTVYLLEKIVVSVAIVDYTLVNLQITFKFDRFSSAINYVAEGFGENKTESMTILNLRLIKELSSKICQEIERKIKEIEEMASIMKELLATIA